MSKDSDYHHEGRVGIELLKELLPSNNFEYYLCGSGAFMKSLTDGLEAWGVPDKDVYFEAFGPATVKKKTAAPTVEETAHLAKINITFGRSGKTVRWESSAGNILEFASAQGVKIDSGCCAGSCGSCVVAIKSGTVDYLKKPDADAGSGHLPHLRLPAENRSGLGRLKCQPQRPSSNARNAGTPRSTRT